MLGTHFPYIGSIKQNVDYVPEAGLSEETQQQILETTAPTCWASPPCANYR